MRTDEPRSTMALALIVAGCAIALCGHLVSARQAIADHEADLPALLIAAGGIHTCATYEDGVRCWGYNDPARQRPVYVRGFPANVRAIDAAEAHACLITTDGALKCWDPETPLMIPPGLESGVTFVDVGTPSRTNDKICAVANGALYCWRWRDTAGTPPTVVAGLEQNVTAVGVGSSHTCALADGGVQCWGANWWGQLGDGTTTDRAAPGPVSGLTTGVQSLVVGDGFSCALTIAGAVKCWGLNNYGQLGDGTWTTNRFVPVDAIGLTNGVTAIAAASAHACAITTDGLKCWGYTGPYRDRLGIGYYPRYPELPVPTAVVGLPGATRAVSAGAVHTCALSIEGVASCWGTGAAGQLGLAPGAAGGRANPVWTWHRRGLALGPATRSSASFESRLDLPALVPEQTISIPWARYASGTGGLRLAFGDVDGDGRDEVVVGLTHTGFSNGWLAVLDDPMHGYTLLRWLQVQWPAYNETYGETFPAVGDIDGDGKAEIVVGLGQGGGGWYEIFDDEAAGFAHLAWNRVNWWAYQRDDSDGRTHPAVADLDGNGEAEIIVGLGPGSNGWLEIVHGASGGFSHRDWIRAQWDAYDRANGTTYPAAGDVDGDGKAEIVIGLGAGGGCWFQVIDDATQAFATLAWRQASWPAYCAAIGELHPAVGQLDQDGGREIVLGLATYPGGDGGWFLLVDDALTGYATVRWRNIGVETLRQAGAGIFPAIGRRW